ncbi:DNA gyrase subunit A [Babesia sp. Xinjiang]|uniref:DNA gyrase subunit A n=1 Tax=Babesia sp. Xinjiang TaxID=462227 RepID=UPI000A227BA9|nr:DNA gyrase subunit A [Babesia sp. Xinjiang]ORM39844.1 DNA gyrase subunit A [Babesia sp. Xinjiang]
MRRQWKPLTAAYACAVIVAAAIVQQTLAFRQTSTTEPLVSYSRNSLSNSWSNGAIYAANSLGEAHADDINEASASKNEGNEQNTMAEAPQYHIQDLELCEEISDSFMKYALSIILGRALPDARDGLKIVHRRILWAMQDLKLGATTPYRKCAKVVGDVLGKYHPHSDKSVYDALCRLAQRFMMRVPLVDGHGNFGSTDDPPAAMRYTECRLSHFSEKMLLNDIQKDTVNMLPNFDSTEIEPTVLPAKVPALLINGSSGIAVGLATNIPPHNPNEIIEAAILMAKRHGDVDPEELLYIVKGPDFPTGGHITTTMENMRKIYNTGKGSIMLQARFTFEERIKPRNSKKDTDTVVNTYNKPSELTFSAGSRASIIVTELPYNVRLRDVMISISKAVETGGIRGIADLRDESDRSGLRLVIDLKKQITTHIELEEIMNKLIRMGGLCSYFKCNFIALDSSGTKPVRLTLYKALKIWLDFRVETLKKRTKYLLKHAKERINIVKGFIIAAQNIDNIVQMVRNSSSPADARKLLSEKKYGALNDDQAAVVLRMTLSQLSKLEREKFEVEEKELIQTINTYNSLLDDEKNIYSLIRKELEEIKQQPKKHYNTKRRYTTLTVAGRPKRLAEVDVNTDVSTDIDTDDTASDLDDQDFGKMTMQPVKDNHEMQELNENNDDNVDKKYDDPTLIVINNQGWMQRVKLDSNFFTSQRARSIYTHRVYQPQESQHSINTEQQADDDKKDDEPTSVTIHHSLCRPDGTALVIMNDGICIVLPVEKLRICSRGYSLWKILKSKQQDNIAQFMVTNKIRLDSKPGELNERNNTASIEHNEKYLVVGFDDGDVSIISASCLLTARVNKVGYTKLRLWKNRIENVVFATIATANDDILVGTAQGYSLRVNMNELITGFDKRIRTSRKLIRLRDGDNVSCGVLLEGPFQRPEGGKTQGATQTGDSIDEQSLKEVVNRPEKHVMLLSQGGKAKLLPSSEITLRRHGGYGYDITRQAGSGLDKLAAAIVVNEGDNVLMVSEKGLLARKDPYVIHPGRRHYKMRNFWPRMNDDDVLKYAMNI